MKESKIIRFAEDICTDTAALRRAFNDPLRAFGPFLYLPMTNGNTDTDLTRTERAIACCKKDGYAGVIPFYPADAAARPFTEGYTQAMSAVYESCAAYGLKGAYSDDPTVMAAWLAANPDQAPELECRILSDYEHVCVAGETFVRETAGEGKLLSLVAVESDTAEILDLRHCIGADGRIEWQVPEGNWILHRYTCDRDPDAGLINLLDYDSCFRYLSASCRPLLDSIEEESRGALRLLVCRNVQYGGQNRRMWSEDFNEVFRARYGFDPAPYYPCLFQDAGPASHHYRALLMSCRASMLSDGYMKAAADFAAARDMIATGFAAESRATACSWLFGDGQMLHRHTVMPGIAMPFAYLYGVNGIKVAAASSDGADRGLLSADMFRHYPSLSDDILYRETLNAFGRGVNFLMTHLGGDGDKQPEDSGGIARLAELFSHNRDAEDYCEFCARASLLLRGGRHVSDIAVLYPIHAIHARTYLYEFSLSGFEYPAVLENADYMTVMNNLLTYGCTDGEFLHPDVLSDSCHSEDGYLYRNTPGGGGRYSTVILPGTDVISVRAMRMLAKFFDGGGRILATECLPQYAFEVEEPGSPRSAEITGYDAEVRALCTHIFGEDAANPGVFREIYQNTGERGGISCFIPAITTAVDGTDMVPAADMMNVVNSLVAAPDVIFTDPVRLEYGGVVGYDLPTYQRLGVDSKLVHSGSVGYLHRKSALADVYFITNTAETTYENEVLLRGRHTPEEWNPYRGKIHRIPFEHVRYRGEVYTLVRLSVPAVSGTFLVSPNPAGNREALRMMGVEEELREYTPAGMK